ncbi:MAG: hypothetical protein KatS3mg071_2008 [Meiothermus sp.]|nr:MAG: hypothetical protein KatS3mg071_2008 [Meiothermus sp.]
MNLWLTLRNIRAYWIGRREGKKLSRKHASLAYLTPNPFPNELKERFARSMEANKYRYEQQRERLEARLEGVRHGRQTLERVVGAMEPTPEAFAHIGAWAGRSSLLVMVFGAEMVYNKLAMDALGLTQAEAWVVAFVATVAMFWMGHEAGNQFRKNNLALAAPLLVLPLLLAGAFAFLRAAFTTQQVQILQLTLPTQYALPVLLILGIVLVAFTFVLGYKSPTEHETLLNRYQKLVRQERLLKRRLQAFQFRTERRLGFLHAHYREEVAAYWRGFARAWPQWDPAPEFAGYVPPLETPPLRPLNLLEDEVNREGPAPVRAAS